MAEENQSNMYRHALAIAVAAVLTLSGCHKKTVPPPPPPPPGAAPTATIAVSPSSIQVGESASLTWQTTDATVVSIEGIGAVQPNGSQSVSPTESTTYHLMAKGAGGTQEATSRLTVAQPAPPPELEPASAVSDEDLFNQQIKDVFFDYDKSDIRADQQSSVQADLAFLNAHANMNLTVEGHCDERGSTEYNIALGDLRASVIKSVFTAAGVSVNRIKTVSYGKERPFCPESNKACWQQNRRSHFVYEK
jgi:peptidoglycan-associated lipoprotein